MQQVALFHRYFDGNTIHVYPVEESLMSLPWWMKMDESVDREYSWEDYIRIDAALKSGAEVFVLSAGSTITTALHLCGESAIIPASHIPENIPIISVLPRRNVLEMMGKDYTFATRYWENPIINAAMRRDYIMGDCTYSDEPAIVDGRNTTPPRTMRQFTQEHEHVFFKRAYSKGGTYHAHLSIPDGDPLSGVAEIMDEYEPPLLLVQEYVDFIVEARFFIVNGTVVTYAERNESHIPAMIQETSLLPLHTNHENSQDYLNHKDSLLQEALRLASELGNHSYVLDLGIIRQDTSYHVAVVELNPLSNSGLYGCDAYKLMDAVMSHGGYGVDVGMWRNGDASLLLSLNSDL